MKRLNQALLAIFLACGVYAESQGKSNDQLRCMKSADSCVAQDGCLETVIPLEVVVYVKNGVPIRTETNRIAATSTQGHVSRTADISKAMPSVHE